VRFMKLKNLIIIGLILLFPVFCHAAATDYWVDNNGVVHSYSLITKGFQLGTSATAGYVLTTNTSGVGTWQAGGGSIAWGSITGTLSNQTDLQNALNAKESALTFQYSVYRSGNTINLLNDSASPPASYYYGTDSGGTRGFFILPSTSGMIYPGPGIAVSTGSMWGTSITDNSDHWNTAYGWGYWAHTTLAGYGITDAAPLAHKTTEDAINGLVFVNGAGTYSAKVIGTDVQAYNSSLAAIAGGTWIGANSITTLGTIGTGVWQGTAIGDTYISSANNWTTAYTGRVTTWNSPLQFSSNTASILQASTTVSGYLLSTDWNTFNTKEPAISAGATSQYWRGDKSWQTLNQAAVAGLTTSDSPTFTGLTLSGVTSTGASIKLQEGPTSGNTFIAHKAPNTITTSVTYTWPELGTTGYFLKLNDSGGTLVWAAASGGGMTDPMTTIGDMIYRNSSNITDRRAIGTTGQILTVSGGLPVWATPATGLTVGGSDKDVQVNASGTFGADTGVFTYDYTNHMLSVLGSYAGSKLSLTLRNTSTGTTSYNQMSLGNDIASDRFYIRLLSSYFSGLSEYSYIISKASAPMILGVNGSEVMRLTGTYVNIAGLTASQVVMTDASKDLVSQAPAALTKTDDTNMTLTLGGTPATALLQAVSLTLAWTGTLADGKIASATNWNAAYSHKTTEDALSGLVFVSGGSYSSKVIGSDVQAFNANLATIAGLTPVQNKIMVGSGTPAWSVSSFTVPATPTANKALIGDGTNFILSTPTVPFASSPAAGKVMIGDGTNWVASTPTYPNTSPASGKILIGDGTNFIASTPTYPNASSPTVRKILVSDGTNWVASTETYAVPGTSGNVMTSNGTNWISSTPSSMVYPGAGIALSTGSAWGTSITDNSANWNTAYTNRVSSWTSPLQFSSNTASILQASTSASGYLSSTDWNTFNNKEFALTFQYSLYRAGNTINLYNDSASPGNSQYYGTDSGGARGFHTLPSGTVPTGTQGDMVYKGASAWLSGKMFTNVTAYATIAAAVASGNKLLFIPEGTYTEAISLSSLSDIFIMGAGNGTKIRPSSGSALTVSNCSHCTVSNLMLDGSGGASSGITINVAPYDRFQNLYISGFSSYGININGDGSTETYFRDIYIDAINDTCFNYTRGTTTDTGGIYLDRVNLMHEGGSGTKALNISCASYTNVFWEINNLVVDAYASSCPITITNAGDVRAMNVWVSNNVANDGSIKISGGGQQSYVQMRLNNGNANAYGINFINGANHISFEAVEFPEASTNGYCIYFDGSSYTDINLGRYRTEGLTPVLSNHPSYITVTSTGGAGGGITSLNGLTVSSQTFVNDTNVTITSTGSTHTLGWQSTLADGRIYSASNWNTAYTNRVSSWTSPLQFSSNTASILQASTSASGYLSSTDWNTFNNKQNTLTNPVTGTGTMYYLAAWSSTNSIQPLASLGTSGYVLTSTGGSSLPTWQAATGGGNVSTNGTPALHQWGVWYDSSHIKGVAVTASKVACTDSNGEPIACTNLTDTTVSAFDPTVNSVFYEDFNALYENSWELFGTVAASAQDRNGVIVISGDDASIIPLGRPAQSNISTPYVQSKNPTVIVREAQFGATQTTTRYFGLASGDLTAVPYNGIYFRHAKNSNYFGVCRKAGSESTIDTGVTAANGTFHTLKFVVTGTTSVQFFVDGSSKGSITNATYIPTVNMYFSLGDDDATFKSTEGLYIDYVYISQNR